MCVLLSAAYTVRVKMLMLRKRACLRKAGLIAAVMKRAVLSFTQCRYPVNSVSPAWRDGDICAGHERRVTVSHT